MNFEHFYDAECAFKSIEDIAGKHVTVMGLGLNGGGIASALFFAKRIFPHHPQVPVAHG